MQQELFEEMVARIRETDVSVPVPLRGYEYYRRFEKGMQYPVHARRLRVDDSAEEVLLDLNAMAVGHSFMALGAFSVSDDDSLLAYSADDTGFRQYRLIVRSLASDEPGRLIAERVTSVAWADDNRTLLYVTEDPVTKRSDTLWRQALGGEPEQVLREDDEAFSLNVRRTRSREWFVLTSGSHTTSECRVLRASDPHGLWRTLIPRRSEIEYDIEHHGPDFLVRINDTGRNFRVARLSVDGAGGELDELMPHDDAVMIEDINAFANHVVLSERIDGVPQLHVMRLPDGERHRVAFPEASYDVGMHANPEWDVPSIRIGYESFVTPTSIYDYGMDDRTLTLLKQEEVLGGYDPTQYVTERTHAIAADGTKVPISLVRRIDVPRRWHRTGPAYRVRRLRLSVLGVILVVAGVVAQPRRRVRRRTHTGWGRPRQGVARRRPDAAQAEHLLRLHRVCRAPAGHRARGTRSPRDRGRQRRWPPDGCRDESPSGSLRGSGQPRAVCRCGDHDE